MVAESGSERLCCNHMRQFLCLHFCPNFDRCDERRCAELTLSSLATQTIALDVPTQEQVVNKRWIIQNSAVPAWKEEGHDRLERARDRFAQAAKEPEDEGPRRKRHRPEGEGEQPFAPPGEGSSSGSCSSSGSALPSAPPRVPPPLEPPPLAKHGLEQETEMTDATVEQQGDSKRRREHPEVPRAADSRCSSSSESSTDTEMGFVNVCSILRDNSEAESRCEGGPITLDLTKWDFNKADCRTKCRKKKEKI